MGNVNLNTIWSKLDINFGILVKDELFEAQLSELSIQRDF